MSDPRHKQGDTPKIEGRYTLPTSVGISAVVQVGFVLCALLFFKTVADDLILEPAPAPPIMAKLTLPPDFMKARIEVPPPEPPEPEKVEVAKAEAPEPVKLKRRAKRQIIKKKPKKTVEAPKQDIEYVNKAKVTDDPANSSPAENDAQQDEAGSDKGIARTGDPKGTVDPKARDHGVAPEDAVDRKALMRGYVGDLNRAVRKDYKYPLAAKRSRIEGIVLVELVVDASGNIVRVAVVRSSGHDVLDRAAVASVRSVGRVPAPPKALGWKKKTFRVPFKYRFAHTG